MELFNKILSKEKPQATSQPNFVFGIEDTFAVKDSDDIIVVGDLKGTVVANSAAYLHTWKDDNNNITLIQITAIEVDQKFVSTATNCSGGLRIKDGKKLDIRIGSVLATRNITANDVHSSYINAIGNAYVGFRHLDLKDDELKRMSITDMTEAWRLYLYSNQNGFPGCDTDPAIQRKKMDHLATVLCQRIFTLNKIHIVYSTLTAEPYLFSETIAHDNGTYESTPPEIMLVTEPYLAAYQESYGTGEYQIKTIAIDANPNAIKQMFYEAFYLNGATGLRINSRAVGVVAEKILPPPSYDGVPEINIPITNPNLMRWKLLMGQFAEPLSEEEKTLYKIYYGFFLQELTKATFLIPMKQDIPCPPPDADGKTVVQKDTKLMLSTLPGKKDRPAVRMYTDWKRMRESLDTEWDSMIQPISGMIEVMDIAMNVTEHPAVGCYIDKEIYEEAVNRAS